MPYTIPYFSHDIVGRIVPGTIALFMMLLVDVSTPQPWVAWMALEAESFVIKPLIYGGLAFFIGFVLDATCSPFLNRVYCVAWAFVLRDYSWRRSAPTSQTFKERTSVQSARDSFEVMLQRTSQHEPQVLAHALRFHAESRMLASVFVILSALLLGSVVAFFSDSLNFKPIENRSI